MQNPGETTPPQPAAVVATNRAAWLEIGAVVLLTCAPTLASLGRSVFWGSEFPITAQHRRHAEHQTAAQYETALFDSMVLRLRFVPVVLLVMWRSGAGWAFFGLVKPRLKDILVGLGLWLVVAIIDALIALAFYRHNPWLGLSAVAIPWRRAGLLLGDCCAIGFAEELTCRAYLIPRLGAVTGATWKGVVLSVLLFAFNHLYKGPVGVVHSVAAAVVWSIGFCLTRRIWPVAFSHAMTDYIVESHLAATIGL
jgi:membrane protease YdiL (CAAX protease family)